MGARQYGHEHRRPRSARQLVAVICFAVAVVATTGGALALARGVFSKPSQQPARPAAALAAQAPSANSGHATAPTSSSAPKPKSSPTPTPTAAPTPKPAKSAATGPSAPAASSAAPQPTAGTLLTSAGGSVEASCKPGGAYLISWSPAQGYEVGDVVRGPAAVASIQFERLTTELDMTVSCSSGTPVAKVSDG